MLDTHVWLWWIHGSPRLPRHYAAALRERRTTGVAVSAVSCWEAAMLHARGSLEISDEFGAWLDRALGGSGVRVLDLDRTTAVEACRLPGDFHRDPADRFIVATARVAACPLATFDAQILAYPHVQHFVPDPPRP